MWIGPSEGDSGTESWGHHDGVAITGVCVFVYVRVASMSVVVVDSSSPFIRFAERWGLGYEVIFDAL